MHKLYFCLFIFPVVAIATSQEEGNARALQQAKRVAALETMEMPAHSLGSRIVKKHKALSLNSNQTKGEIPNPPSPSGVTAQ